MIHLIIESDQCVFFYNIMNEIFEFACHITKVKGGFLRLIYHAKAFFNKCSIIFFYGIIIENSFINQDTGEENDKS